MEQKIQTKIIKYLKSQDIYVVKTIAVSRNGVPDLICCINGLFFAFEIKDIKGIVSPLQTANIIQIQSCGGYAFVVRSLDEVKVILHKCFGD